jgi:hypothetical protein
VVDVCDDAEVAYEVLGSHRNFGLRIYDFRLRIVCSKNALR